VIEKRLEAAATSDLITGLYNPKSGRRTQQLMRAQEIFLKHRSPRTPVGIVKSCLRKRQVVDITIEKGQVVSKVQGTQPRPYRVTIEMKQISDKEWEKVADAMAERQLQRSQAEILRIEVLPAHARLKGQTGPEGPHDLAEYLHWLQGQEQAIDARRSYVDAVWGLRQAQSEFMRALYGGVAQAR
jgi:hypothetical protein